MDLPTIFCTSEPIVLKAQSTMSCRLNKAYPLVAIPKPFNLRLHIAEKTK